MTGAILISDDLVLFHKSSSNIRHQQTRQYLKYVFFHEKMLIKMFIKSKISFTTLANISVFLLFPNMESFFGDLSSSCAFLFPENRSELSKDRIASKKDKFETRLNFLLRRQQQFRTCHARLFFDNCGARSNYTEPLLRK